MKARRLASSSAVANRSSGSSSHCRVRLRYRANWLEQASWLQTERSADWMAGFRICCRKETRFWSMWSGG